MRGEIQSLGVGQTAVGGDHIVVLSDGGDQAVEIRGAENYAGIHKCASFLFVIVYHRQPKNKSPPGSNPEGNSLYSAKTAGLNPRLVQEEKRKGKMKN